MIILGDCLERLRELPENSVDAVVTDPPAGISFMSKSWDSDKGGRDHWIAWLTEIMSECKRVLKPGGHAFVWALPRTSHWTATACENAGFEIRDIAMHIFGSGFPKSHNVSKAIDKHLGAEREVVGTIKKTPYSTPDTNPGLQRPSHNFDADPEVRNQMQITSPATPEAQQWDGWGTSLKPAAEHWILCRKPLIGTVAQNVLEYGTGGLNIDQTRIKPSDEAHRSNSLKPLISPNVYADILESLPDSFSGFCALSLSTIQDLLSRISSGPLACNIGDKAFLHSLACVFHTLNNQSLGALDGCDLPAGHVSDYAQNSLESLSYQFGYPTLRRFCGALSRNLRALDPSDVPLLTDVQVDISHALSLQENILLNGNNLHLFCAWVFAWAVCTAKKSDIQATNIQGRWPANVIFDEEAAEMLDEQSGHLHPAGNKKPSGTDGTSIFGIGLHEHQKSIDSVGGGASRFFYCAKASKRERNAGLEGMATKDRPLAISQWEGQTNGSGQTMGPSKPQQNFHPTVKPIRLMQYLIKLITPPGGVVLDPFAGSGSTLVAAKSLGFEFIGIELSAEYVAIAEKRIESVQSQMALGE